MIALAFFSCEKTAKKNTVEAEVGEEKIQLFTALPASQTGVDFVNTLEETLESNYYQYLYTYIGGGVAAGDINNDGLIDLYFTSNQSNDKLYLNKGNFKFEDVTKKAGIKQLDGFNTGVTMADVNNDGLLDIYISRGGWKDDNNKFANLLYINKGDTTFIEKAAELGLNDTNRTIHATFFDYDNDNDLDVYISNSPDITGKSNITDVSITDRAAENLKLKGCDRLYNNDGTGHFTDVSKEAKLKYDLGFGLNPQVCDLNGDGWLDIYVCNDFEYPDLVYINNKDGTFNEARDDYFKHISYNSMGSDVADINNDGLFDLTTLDMNPEDYIRSKTTMSMTPINKFEAMVNRGYHYQYMHNMLQINNGNQTFSDIGKMAGIANTDWSWSVLSADFDLDGYNDFFITNGIFRDVNEVDKLNEARRILRENGRKPTPEDLLKFTQLFSQQKLDNYFFRNKGDLNFENVSETWSNEPATFSNGAVYADLDNDGDLDIVVNNINDKASVLRNNAADANLGNHLAVSFKGPAENPFGLGAIAEIKLSDNTILKRQLINTRGFLSSVSNTLHFGIPKETKIEHLTVRWLDGKTQIQTDVNLNQSVTIDYKEATKIEPNIASKTNTLLEPLPTTFKHEDPYFNDFDIQILLPHKLSQTGPALAKGDVNNDGLEDVFIGGANGRSAQLLLGTDAGLLSSKQNDVFISDKKYEDVGAVFFDSDGDGDQDLYVVNGSYEFYGYPNALQDRLYLNDGSGRFDKSEGKLPEIKSAGSKVVPFDFDEDGDIDLFVGGRVTPGKYPFAPQSFLLQNNNGVFSNVTSSLAPELENIGMVTDAVWNDINEDGKVDLILTGEWMGIEILLNNGKSFAKTANYVNLASAKGWWNALKVVDIDNDGDKDIIAGNLGLNYKFHASQEKPFKVYTTDFNFDGTQDVILAKEYKGREVPVRGKTCMTQQIPQLAEKIPNYEDFANKNLEDILGKRLNNALTYQATEFRSGIFLNNGPSGFGFSPFENPIQRSPINSILFTDVNGDGHNDIIIAGNNYQSEVETTRADAGIGAVLMGDGNGQFEQLSHLESGFFVDKDVRAMALVKIGQEVILFVANNNDYHSLFKVNM